VVGSEQVSTIEMRREGDGIVVALPLVRAGVVEVR
jgi:hypothetical protein